MTCKANTGFQNFLSVMAPNISVLMQNHADQVQLPAVQELHIFSL